MDPDSIVAIKNCTKKVMLFVASMGEMGLCHDNSHLGLSIKLDVLCMIWGVNYFDKTEPLFVSLWP